MLKLTMNATRGLFTVGGLLACGLGLSHTARATEVVVKNDSFTNGQNVVIVGDFIAGEQASARLTSPCFGTIVAVQIAWLEGVSGHDPSIERAIRIYEYNEATWPNPGPELAFLDSPLLTPGFFNEFRYLDEANTVPISVPVNQGQSFIVALQFDNPTNVALPNGGPSVARDINGCQAKRSAIRAIPGGWIDLCTFTQGDFLIRAVVDCDNAPGACCFPNGACLFLSQTDCAATGIGEWKGPGTTCADDDGDGTADQCGSEPCVGDVDGDDDVDLTDLSVVLGAYGSCNGQPAYNAAADFDETGCIDLADLAIGLNGFGAPCP